MRTAFTRTLLALLAVLGLVGCKRLARHQIEAPCLYGGPVEIYKDMPADSVSADVEKPQQEMADNKG